MQQIYGKALILCQHESLTEISGTFLRLFMSYLKAVKFEGDA